MLVDKTPRKTKINSGSDKHFESISSFKQEVTLKLSHTLDPRSRINDNDQFYTGSLNLVPGVVNKRS